ncbi:MAG: hypothetical protein ACXWID_18315 [Pyrinomonadaceae bacterium]
MSKEKVMKWYYIGFSEREMTNGDHLKLIEKMRTFWEENGKPDDFAFFGSRVGSNRHHGFFTVFYLTHSAHRDWSSQVLTIWELKPRDTKPSPERLKVLVGEEGALRLLD